MHNLEYALVILGTKIEKSLDPEIGQRIIELASFSHKYQPPQETSMLPEGLPDEEYLSKFIRVYDDNFIK